MKRFLITGGGIAAAALLGSCSTMSKDECLAGAWGEKGYADGAAGYPMSRLDDHAKACEKYLPAYNDGRRLHEVEAAVASAESALSSAEARIEDREDKLDAKQRELRSDGLTDDEKQRIRDRIDEVRGEIRSARRNAREARDALDRAEWDLRQVRGELSGRYPVF